MLGEVNIEFDVREDVEDAVVVEVAVELNLGIVPVIGVTPKPKSS